MSWRTAMLALSLLSSAFPAAASETRRFTFEYEVTLPALPDESGALSLFVPLAAETEQQHILVEEIEASIPGAVASDGAHGNRFWRSDPARGGGPIEVRVSTTVERRVSRVTPPAASRPLDATEREAFAAFLGPNQRVLVGHPVLEPILAEVRERAGSDDPAALARAIYDWVVDNVEYKKVGTGWGNGDTFWACTERYGNCTDFHALFISLARSVGIPARFEIGFPVPEAGEAGAIGGYHCWVEFWLPEVGWFPIDASEAAKHPERRGFYYGAHPGDRIHLSTGRDLRLGEGHAGKPLNYFVYPHVELNGAEWTGVLEKSFSWREAPR